MRVLVSGLIVLAAVGAAGPVGAESWPTPYTAEEIRDEWAEGFWLDTRVETDEGVKVDRIEVLEWSSEGAVLRERPDGTSDDAARELASMPVTWEQLRSHALFDKATVTRGRESRETPLGTLEGWLFSKVDETGTAEFFFADDLPGPPITYSKTGTDGERTYLAVQVGRHGIELPGSD